MNKGFKDYIGENFPEYQYTIKLAVDDVTDCMIDCLEACMVQYEIKTASKFRKTPIQESPLDFPNISNSPVFIADITLAYPASRDYLRTKISNVLGISEQAIAVYSKNDPRKAETDLYIDRMVNHTNKGNSMLAKDSYEGEVEEVADFEEQRMDLLKELENERKKREPAVAEKDNVLPPDYDSFDKQRETESPGLFGRMNPKPKKGVAHG